MKIIDLILKYKTALIAVTLVLTVAVAAVLYNSLSDQYGGGSNAFTDGSQSDDSVTSDGETAEKPDSNDGSEEKASTDGGEDDPDTGDGDRDNGGDADAQAPTIFKYDFTALDADGNTVKLSDYAGKPIVLNFWATWCPYCIDEMPDFDKAAKELTDVTFLMVNATGIKGETVEGARAFVDKRGFEFSVLYDTKGEAVNTYGVSGFPMTFFIDSGGRIQFYHSGIISIDGIKSVLKQISEQ